jgi:thiamine biosynthesis protein ThiS
LRGVAQSGYAQRITIMLNGDRYELDGPVTVSGLLAHLEIDPRRVAVEHNLLVVRRAAYESTMVHDGDQIEIVNFVGGG